MFKLVCLFAISTLAHESAAFAVAATGEPGASQVQAQRQQPGDNSTPGPGKVCKHVVSAEQGTKPYRVCLTKAEWKSKEAADAKNPNRIVCRYVEHSGSKFKSYKVCMTAAEWENSRQRDRQALERIQSSTCVFGAGC